MISIIIIIDNKGEITTNINYSNAFIHFNIMVIN